MLSVQCMFDILPQIKNVCVIVSCGNYEISRVQYFPCSGCNSPSTNIVKKLLGYFLRKIGQFNIF